MKITVCIGSSCHVKGSRQVVETLNRLIAENALQDKVSMGGTFCLGKCGSHVSISVDDTYHSVSPENVEAFFQQEILAKV